MNWYKAAQRTPKFRVERRGTEFVAFLGRQQIGRAYLSNYGGGKYILSAIDINEDKQRQGYGTLLMREIASFLQQVGAVSLSSSNEGSGTVQMLDKVFGRENVHHFHGGGEIDFEQAKHVMDVQYGYTRSEVNFQPPVEGVDE